MNKFVLNVDNCKGCGLCIRACPKSLLKFGEVINTQGVRFVTMTGESQCVSCACCAINCPDMCISIYKEA